MSNEELVEEIYHKAYRKGFIDDLRQEVGKLKIINSTTPHIDLVEKAYKICKNKNC
jgi:hypothetical protein